MGWLNKWHEYKYELTAIPTISAITSKHMIWFWLIYGKSRHRTKCVFHCVQIDGYVWLVTSPSASHFFVAEACQVTGGFVIWLAQAFWALKARVHLIWPSLVMNDLNGTNKIALVKKKSCIIYMSIITTFRVELFFCVFVTSRVEWQWYFAI